MERRSEVRAAGAEWGRGEGGDGADVGRDVRGGVEPVRLAGGCWCGGGGSVATRGKASDGTYLGAQSSLAGAEGRSFAGTEAEGEVHPT